MVVVTVVQDIADDGEWVSRVKLVVFDGWIWSVLSGSAVGGGKEG